MNSESKPEHQKHNEMGRDLRPSPSGVSGWLKGENVPNANNLRLIVKVLKCELDDLYENDKFSAQRLAKLLDFNKLSTRDFADKLLFASKGLEI